LKEIGPVEEIKKLLECPICQGVPIPPIWNCENGHIACSQCRPRISECGLCRADFDGGRNLFMEEVVTQCTITCPYADKGCDGAFKVHQMKEHAAQCRFGPKIKWISSAGGSLPFNAVEGGRQHGVKLYVIRAPHHGSITPGKLYEYPPPGIPGADVSWASLAWGGNENFKHRYEVLVAPPGYLKWIPSELGQAVPNAVVGGLSEVGSETLYIGRYQHEGQLINGKIQPSHRACYIGINGREIASRTYEILVEVPQPEPEKNEAASKKEKTRSKEGGPSSSSMYS